MCKFSGLKGKKTDFYVSVRLKKTTSLVSRNWPGGKFFLTYPSAKPNVYQNIYFLFQNLKTHTQTKSK